VIDRHAKVFVAGHRGLVGSSLVRALSARGYPNLVIRTRAELDLTDQAAVRRFFRQERPEYVVLAAAKVGGILANDTYPADFIYENLAIETNVIGECFRNGVKRLLFFGSSCIYPRDCPQPIREDYLLTGPLEATNRAYAIAKIAGLEMCAAYNRQHETRFYCAMPTNLYGPEDNFDLMNSHVIPALIRKFHEARESGSGTVLLWGTGAPRRELLHSDDIAEASCHLMELDDASLDRILAEPFPLINVGCGEDRSIREIAELIARVVGYSGRIEWDCSYPDGTPRKLLDVSRILATGWKPRIPFSRGIEQTYEMFIAKRARSGVPANLVAK
jgi:GDP-L-fucose synthase